jgi:hypothetical protein
MRQTWLVVAVATASLFAQPAAAAVMMATFTGTVVQPGGLLNGNAFTATFRYDTNVGNLTLLDGVEIISGGSFDGLGGAPFSPMQFFSMRITGGSQYDITVSNPEDFSSIGNYASAGNQYYGTTGYFDVHAESDIRDESIGFLEFAIIDVEGFAPTGLALDTPFAGAVSGGGTQYSYGRFENGFQIQSLSVNLAPSYVTVESVGGIPEPATWAMLITGFGLTGAMMRRRARALDSLAI